MHKQMEKTMDVVVTSKEVLQILGIRKGTLISLEKAAKVRHVAGRSGYTDEEFKRLVARLRRILAR
jgi:hypothetical protein